MDWNDLFTALCLVLVIEGIMPFLNPKAWKQTLASILKANDRTMRSIALVCMLAGLLGVVLLRQ
ncbi:hypothetical protein A3715_34320 [Oleiphilus sp. HI0009]|uniref:DUF2065 domain-containing protein n=1 Tax=unclassified Oleiphilus TaxID=2631174 RepID=UPI0007C29501|nr:MULTISPECIES: DUF2065 domain-containing protein [unclassified Oleiphilus]KZX75576.1 hypothetical protein A3715_14390 [Oleiphilus sp. HI0009]KZX81971.1 hypothetical protein A3715_34320 [Oleiphilus sp. HI0009]KZY68835.1 hypothetical protein A3739_10140 [Oleiphilus sp. HI0067]KZY69420.1 hypothetical protein A3738_04260 [Oleiphilus sp. HI0066]KZY69819.1 hypothetical protein A3739_18695 [Oleiphilus sp. HI0067]